jgi:DNA-binding MarR family transcriptional regulator
MQTISPSLKLILNLSKAEAIVARRFDTRLGLGIGFNDFVILYHLHGAENHKLRRMDLADRVGLTASAITKLLPPMEKIGLVGRESDPRDARVSYVTLAPGGKRILENTLERAEVLAEELLPAGAGRQAAALADLMEGIR